MSYPNRIPELRVMAIGVGSDVAVLADELFTDPRFAEWTGSVSADKHHHGAGGLQQHTWEVVRLCFSNREVLDQEKHIDSRALFLAAALHDWGKVDDYGFIIGEHGERWWRETPHKRLIHHVNRSAINWTKAVARHGVCRDIEDDVLHAILSHHGQPQWGSSVVPKTKLAWLLHLADQMSARMDDCDRLDLGVRK